jgi:hypothetical protein
MASEVDGIPDGQPFVVEVMMTPWADRRGMTTVS